MFRVVIPSRNVKNLAHCVAAIQKCEPNLPSDSVIVVDDDESEQIKQFCENYSIRRIQGIKPFIFARNANLGLTLAFSEVESVVLLNDDALLRSREGFTLLHLESLQNQQYGILSASTNVTGNTRMYPQRAEHIRREHRTLPFICVLITRLTWQKVGPLDERYCLDYGVEDGDYCYRARQAGRRLGIVDRCFVDHGSLESSYRGSSHRGFEQNKQLFEEKWGIPYESA